MRCLAALLSTGVDEGAVLLLPRRASLQVASSSASLW